MTNNQIAFWTLEHEKAKTARAQKETERSNRAREDETARSNLAKEAETYRSNLAHETETSRSNIARETETKRANVTKETETQRANLAGEQLATQRLAEDTRHNYAQEYSKNLEVETKAWGPIIGTARNQVSASGHGAQQAFADKQEREANSFIRKQQERQAARRANKSRQKQAKSRGSR